MTQEMTNMIAMPTFEEELADLLAIPTIGEEMTDLPAIPLAQGETTNTSAMPASHEEIADLATIPMAEEGAPALATPMPSRMTDYQRIVNQFGGGIDEAQMANWDEWNAAKRWSEVLSLNRKYICKSRTSTPYRLSPINDRTRRMVPWLLSLHDHGMLTYRGEPISFETSTESATADGTMYKEINRLPYLEFLLPRTIANSKLTQFCEHLLRHSGLLTMVYDRAALVSTDSVGQGNIPGTLFPIYRERSAPTKDQLKKAKWGNYRYTFGKEANHQGRWHKWGCQAINGQHPLEFHVLVHDWKPKFNFLQLIEFFASKCGIGKDYQEMNLYYQNNAYWVRLPRQNPTAANDWRLRL
ncbi:MAG: hypothetical protein Q9167_007915 [Letrouitia subvulpina]